MRRIFLIILFIIFYSFEVLACSCSYAWNDSFSLTAERSEFVALVKIISFDDYIEDGSMDHEQKIPYSMTAEIIKKYKGEESRKRIKILGDNGMLCRPYLTDFKINGYYLVAPRPLDNTESSEYDFFACRTDYLNVDITTNKAYGNYSLIRNQIDIITFESKLKHGDWDYIIVVLLVILLILILVVVIRNKKRMPTTE